MKDFQFEEDSSCVSDGDQWSIAVNELDFDIDELINESQQNCWNRIWKSCINYHGIEEKFSHSGTPTFNGGPWPNDPGLLISDEMLENIIGSEINVKYNGKCATCRNGRCVISMFTIWIKNSSYLFRIIRPSLCVASLLMRKRKR